ncbi:MAG: 5-formyltetrahydrofolate cyclo-ligase [Lachnospiraceae bacterium]|nr:5-formyltetrahydrofolate cyclo-ligase [Lachnospiraceae bacterium]
MTKNKSDINLLKNQIRQDLLSKRKMYSKTECTKSSEFLCLQLIEIFKVDRPDILLLYNAYGKEASLEKFIDWVVAQKIDFALPKVSDDTMDFIKCDSLSDLTPGAFGILEPVGTEIIDLKDYCDKSVVCIVPGVGFDKAGHRIGHGKGYYDKYFQYFPQVKLYGVCHDFQLVEEIPTDKYDITMTKVISPNYILDID